MKCFFSVSFLIIFSFFVKGQCPTLIISEYIEGSSSNKALEFTNVGDKPIVLNEFEVRFYNNGATTSSRIFSFPKQVLSSSATFTVVHPKATLFNVYDTTYSFNFNGNDAVELVYKPTEEVVDVIGQVGDNPVDGWIVDTVENATLNHTLTRKPSVNKGSTKWSVSKDSWLVLNEDKVSDFGFHQVDSLVTCETVVEQQDCLKLIFSEYIEGSSQNKAIEITNVSNGTINLKGIRVEQLHNGLLTPSRTLYLPNKLLLSGQTYTMVHPSATALDTTQADTLFNFSFNGNDVLLLINGNTDTLDVLGERGVNPGNSWSISGDTLATLNHTLIRNSNVNTGVKKWGVGVNQWQILPEDHVSDFGKHTVDVLNSCIITSVNTNVESLRKLKTIYTLQGKIIQEPVYNTPLIFLYENGERERIYLIE